MADISKILLPSGDTYDIKDARALRPSTEFTASLFTGITWTQGAIASNNGATYPTSTHRLNTLYLPSAVATVTPLSGYQITLAAYDYDEVYQGMWDGTALVKSGTWHTNPINLREIGNYLFRVCASRDPSTTVAMDPSLGENIIFTTSINSMVYYQNYLLTKCQTIVDDVIDALPIYDGTVV